jgi:hypothetical protein
LPPQSTPLRACSSVFRLRVAARSRGAASAHERRQPSRGWRGAAGMTKAPWATFRAERDPGGAPSSGPGDGRAPPEPMAPPDAQRPEQRLCTTGRGGEVRAGSAASTTDRSGEVTVVWGVVTNGRRVGADSDDPGGRRGHRRRTANPEPGTTRHDGPPGWGVSPGGGVVGAAGAAVAFPPSAYIYGLSGSKWDTFLNIARTYAKVLPHSCPSPGATGEGEYVPRPRRAPGFPVRADMGGRGIPLNVSSE